jgi:hypothetical protein
MESFWQVAVVGSGVIGTIQSCQTTRHSHEGGNPPPQIFGTERLTSWIPAFAGTTTTWGADISQVTPLPAQRISDADPFPSPVPPEELYVINLNRPAGSSTDHVEPCKAIVTRAERKNPRSELRCPWLPAFSALLFLEF